MFEISLSGDKSIGHRAFLCAAFSDGVCVISNIGGGEDLASTRAVLRTLGISIEAGTESGEWSVQGIGLKALYTLSPPITPLDCGNSGTTIRLLAGLLSGSHVEFILDGDSSLRRRPMQRLLKVLQPLGRSLKVGPKGGAPITVGRERSSAQPSAQSLAQPPAQPLAHIHTQIHTRMSSAQIKSAALFASFTLPPQHRISLSEEALSRDHTERMLSALGVDIIRQPDGVTVELTPPSHLPAFDLKVPGDLSSAAFWIAVGALSSTGVIRLNDVGLNPTRQGFLKIARAMGVQLSIEHQGERLGEPVGRITIQSQAHSLRGIEVSEEWALEALDELPLVALLGALAQGETIVRGASELRVKESDRIHAMAQGLNRLGAQVKTTPDGWEIQGVSELKGGDVNSFADHRIASCFLIAQLRATSKITIGQVECVAISYPEFPTLLQTYREQLSF